MSFAALLTVVIPCFRDGARAVQAVRAVRRQVLPPGAALEIVVVDDGSGDGTAARVRADCGELAQVVALPQNLGRAAARNAGARHARGDALLFLDCDCRPRDEHFLAEHLATMASGAVASAGPVEGAGHGFWHRYQLAASERRAAHAAAGRAYAGSTQNVMVRRASFDAIGGFDEGYRGYGFEDRDLLLRLAEQGCLAWTPAARVSHLDDLRLDVVCRKMHEAGGEGAARFSQRHPQAYAHLGYAALDVGLHPALRPAARLIAPFLPWAVRTLQPLLDTRAVPFSLRASMVRAISGVSFLCGTHAREVQRSLATAPSKSA